MKRRLNTYLQRSRINPDELEAVSDDEPEDPMPDVLDIINLPQNTNSEPTPQPSIGIHLCLHQPNKQRDPQCLPEQNDQRYWTHSTEWDVIQLFILHEDECDWFMM